MTEGVAQIMLFDNEAVVAIWLITQAWILFSRGCVIDLQSH